MKNQGELILLAPDFRVIANREQELLPADLESQVEDVWRAETKANPKLFNGRIFSVDRMDARTIQGFFTEYRRFWSQTQKPELFCHLTIRPLAVTAVLLLESGVVFGRRAGHVSQEPGHWELAPAGGVSLDCRRGVSVDYQAQMEQELGEELGLTTKELSSIRPLAAWADPDTHVVDICLEVRSTISARGLHKLFTDSSDGEYEEIIVVPESELMIFVEKHRWNLVRTAEPFLRALGLLA